MILVLSNEFHWATGEKPKTKATKFVSQIETALIKYEREIEAIHAGLAFLDWTRNDKKNKFVKTEVN